jgi:hypothetical protein
MNGSESGFKRYSRRENQLKKDARALQTLMDWPEQVSLYQIKEFVDKFPKYRLTIIMSEKSSRHHTYEGKDFVAKKEKCLGVAPSPYYLYIYFDLVQKHYAAIRHVQSFYHNKFNSTSYKYCHACTTIFPPTSNHQCGITDWKRKEKEFVECRKCGIVNCKNCRYRDCRNCGVMYDKDGSDGELHRCMLLDFFNEDKGYNINENDGKKPALWVYDLESRIETVISKEIEVGACDDDGYYSGDVEFVEIVSQQIANFCYAVNVFTGQKLEYFGENCLNDFLTYMMNYNEGNNIVLAHNGSGYDTRLIYESVIKRNSTTPLQPIMRGTKFIQLRVGKKLMFRDSMNHLNGSLAGLARDFETPTLKGFFPHLFNHVDNYEYQGPIPDKSYFDLSHFKSDKDFEEFNKWYDSYQGEWVFMDELRKYCINDVEVLASVVRKYHDIYFEKFQQSPWKQVTSSSYFHKISKQMITRDLELPNQKDEEFKHAIAAKYKDSWTVLRGVEYAAARQALRGGRTGIGRILCELTPEQIARGCKIKYVDVVSLYPYQQVAHDFPVGPPTINVFDPEFAPCYYHRNSLEVHCKCDESLRFHSYTNFIGKLVNVVNHTQEWDIETIRGKHGFVMATVQPPMMLHPILVRFDEDEKKCNATCELIEKGCFTSAEFHTALDNGYKLIKLHRFDEYKMKRPLWEDFVKQMYIFKMVNSANTPDAKKKQELIETYEKKFDMGPMIEETFTKNLWGKNPAKKAAAKTGLNSGWGKHAQRTILTQSEYVDWQDSDMKKCGDVLFMNVQNHRYSLHGGLHVGGERYLYHFKNDGRESQHNYNNSYLPAACFVPAYGRLQLWEQLNKLGDRVLMYDTDSVVYIYDPDKEYNVPESKIWGEWEEEDVSAIGITGFVGLGPKSYAIRCKDPEYNVVKLKGISQRRATDKLLNYDILRKMVLENIKTREPQQLKIPQTNFEYQMTKGIFTSKILKLLSFDLNDQKGMVGKDFFMYPRGYVGPGYFPI